MVCLEGSLARSKNSGTPTTVADGSWASTAAVRRVMQGNRSVGTKPERLLRSAVHQLGLRYRISERPEVSIPRTADLVFRRARVAVFLDGCYWHGCTDHHHEPRTNSGYWKAKIERNVMRDIDTNRRLRDAGWTVLRFWEHEDPVQCADLVSRVVRDKDGARTGKASKSHDPWRSNSNSERVR